MNVCLVTCLFFCWLVIKLIKASNYKKYKNKNNCILKKDKIELYYKARNTNKGESLKISVTIQNMYNGKTINQVYGKVAYT